MASATAIENACIASVTAPAGPGATVDRVVALVLGREVVEVARRGDLDQRHAQGWRRRLPASGGPRPCQELRPGVSGSAMYIRCSDRMVFTAFATARLS